MHIRPSVFRLPLLLFLFLAVLTPHGRISAQVGAAGEIIVSPTSGLETTENGGQATFSIVLDRAPFLFAVKIGLSTSDESEGTVSPSFVTFNSETWDEPQTVTVTGVDDSSTDGDIPFTIITSPAESLEAEFSGVDPDDVAITNLDNEGGPVANPDTAETDEGKAIIINVLANDAALTFPPYTITIDAGPANGTAAVTADNAVRYTPQDGFTGSDSFDYLLCDERLRCSSTEVTINILNPPPVANDDSYSISQNTALSTTQDGDLPGVLDNDTDANGDPLTARLVTEPPNGTLSLDSDGTFSYTPDGDFVGKDVFKYQASDGSSNSNVATATIEVNDTVAPQLEWTSPSENREVYQVGKETVTLQVNASDNTGISEVKFFRWDPINERYVDIDKTSSAPFQVDLSADQLVPGWNQIFARAYDTAGNYSEAEYIWLFHSIRIYIPILYP